MIKKNEYILEFDKIKNRLSDYAVSDDAKQKCLELYFFNNIHKINSELNETKSAYDLLNLSFNLKFEQIKNINEILKLLQIKSQLNQSEIIQILKILDQSQTISNYFNNHNNETLSKYYTKINPLKQLNDYIKTIVISENEISDNASTVLKEIRQKINILNNKLQSISSRLINTYRSYLQEPIITTKNNKICLPVKSEYKSKIHGIVIDISHTSSTIYIEPNEIIETENKINELKISEQNEINKILYNLSLELSKYIDIINNNYTIIIRLDFIFSKAKYAIDNNYTLPIINTNRNIKLINAKHPLIDKNKCVPLDIELTNKQNCLIITGPNTGGKTVCLKTIGLITMMANAGLFIPTYENSTIPVFDEIYVDIGDEQSIEQSLSTFSSHMKNIIDIVNNATKDSLCLIDEICTGTDPIEGANLAISILDDLINKQCLTITTTHYPELKLYALSNEKILNGSFEFNVETLMPTYRLLLGIPGKSNAFIISEKLGLKKQIIKNAKNNIHKNDIKFEEIISDLEASKLLLEKQKKEIEKDKQEIFEMREKVKRQQKGLDDRTNATIRKAKIEAKNLLLEAKEKVNNVIKQATQIDKQNLNKNKNELNKMISNIDSSMLSKAKGPSKPISPKNIKVGMMVKIINFDTIATVETLPDKDYNLFVNVNGMRIKTNIKQIELAKNNNKVVNNININKQYINKIKTEKILSTTTEINIIGKTTDEAINLLDKYIDDAYISHMPYVRIIHGRGTGALKKSVHEYLRKSKIVKEYKLADYDDGGDGATIVTFIE